MDHLIDKLITIGGSNPRQVARTVLIFLLFGYASGRFTQSVFRHGLKRTILYFGFMIWKTYKGDTGYQQEMITARKSFQRQLYHEAVKNTPINRAIPMESTSSPQILSQLKKWSAYEEELWNGKRRNTSGAVYHGGKALTKLQNEAYSLFSYGNPIHPDVFPFLRKLESEVIAMTISYFNGNPYKEQGLLTNGGTESIVMAVRAYKNWGKRVKGIYHPELIISQSAHCAFIKACEMFEIKCVIVHPNQKTFCVEAAQIKKYITSNTIAIVGSAPNYAQGVMDPIQDLSKLAIEYHIGLHVDCCLGSFLLPTLKRMGYDIPPFDFKLPGVTSISADTHKYGYAQKGTSVVMFRDNALRRDAYFANYRSSIGLYTTPTIQGSRSGGVIAAAWASIMSMGQEGYQKDAAVIMDAVNVMREGIDAIDGIEVAGDPVMAVVGIISNSDLNMYHISTAMSDRGWTMNNCKDPPCPHFCVTRANCVQVKERFVADLKDAVQDVRNNPNEYAKCDGAMYGALISLPDDITQMDVMYEYLDVLLGLVDEELIR